MVFRGLCLLLIFSSHLLHAQVKAPLPGPYSEIFESLDAAGKFQVFRNGLHPLEVAVIVNRNDGNSVALGNYYMAAHNLPSWNKIEVSFTVSATQEEMPMADFQTVRTQIYTRVDWIFKTYQKRIRFLAVAWMNPYKLAAPPTTVKFPGTNTAFPSSLQYACMSFTAGLYLGYDTQKYLDYCTNKLGTGTAISNYSTSGCVVPRFEMPYRQKFADRNVADAQNSNLDTAYDLTTLHATDPQKHQIPAMMIALKALPVSTKAADILAAKKIDLDASKKMIDRGVASIASLTDPKVNRVAKAYFVKSGDDVRSVRYPYATPLDMLLPVNTNVISPFTPAAQRSLVFDSYDAKIKGASGVFYSDASCMSCAVGNRTENYYAGIRNATNVLMYFSSNHQLRNISTNTFLPGAIGDHLTSFGGQLYGTSQTSITELLNVKMGAEFRGLTGSFGNVREPCAYIQKFPHIDAVSKHYYRGMNLGTAYWSSVYWSAEGLFVGDPLARPFRPVYTVVGSKLTFKLTSARKNKYYTLKESTSLTGNYLKVRMDNQPTDSVRFLSGLGTYDFSYSQYNASRFYRLEESASPL